MSDLTVAELRSLIATDLEDAALQLLIDAAEEQLAHVPSGEITEEYRGGSAVVILRHPVDSITRIREADAGEDLDDGNPDAATAEYRLMADGRSVYRVVPGYSSYHAWSGPVTVVSTPRSYANLRKLAAVQLVKGALNHNPGVLGMTEGNWTIQFMNGTTWEASVDDALAVVATPWSFA